jgi:hypothetical protein
MTFTKKLIVPALVALAVGASACDPPSETSGTAGGDKKPLPAGVERDGNRFIVDSDYEGSYYYLCDKLEGSWQIGFIQKLDDSRNELICSYTGQSANVWNPE